ncbi:hypothetical protein [Ruania alba]|nr:hypothetical protein [Ruania alba]
MADLELARDSRPGDYLMVTHAGIDVLGRFRLTALFEYATEQAIAWQEGFPDGMIGADAWIAPDEPEYGYAPRLAAPG